MEEYCKYTLLTKSIICPENKNGGSYRARTYDLLLVRQMLSQLSYAPVCASSVLRTSATWFIIHRVGRFVKHFFQIFYY